MDDPLRAICRSHGVFLTREALELGYDDRTFRRLVRAGTWHRVRHGAYTFPDIWTPLTDGPRHQLLSKAAHRTARTPVAISHTSAIVSWTDSWWDLDLREVDLTRLDGRAGRREAGVRQHQGVLRPDDLVDVDGFTLTSPTRSALDFSTTGAGLERVLVVFDGLLREEKTEKPLLQARYQPMVHHPGSLVTQMAITLSDGRSGSVGESRQRFFFWQQHLPMPDLQRSVFDAAGLLLGITDFWWDEYNVAGEFDGMAKCSRLLHPDETPAQAVVREKKREDAIREETGARFIRFVWSDFNHREATRLRVENTLRGPRFARHFL